MTVNGFTRVALVLSAYAMCVGVSDAWDQYFAPDALAAAGISPSSIQVSRGLAFLPGVCKLATGFLTDTRPIGRLGWRRPLDSARKLQGLLRP